jgi:hypothetical protein
VSPVEAEPPQSPIRHDLDAAGARMRRPLWLAGTVVGVSVVAGIALSRFRVIAVLRGGFAAGLTAYRVISVLTSVVAWLERSRLFIEHPSVRMHRPERDPLLPWRGMTHWKTASRQRVIVAATDLSLYHTLRAVFGSRDGVEVVLDRRRSNGTAWPASERRARPEIDAEIRSTGWARVVLPLAS